MIILMMVAMMVVVVIVVVTSVITMNILVMVVMVVVVLVVVVVGVVVVTSASVVTTVPTVELIVHLLGANLEESHVQVLTACLAFRPAHGDVDGLDTLIALREIVSPRPADVVEAFWLGVGVGGGGGGGLRD